MVKVLAIGNSFSIDAMRYLRDIAQADGEKIKPCNAAIGGCSLSKHFRMMRSERPEYMFFFNGEDTGMRVTLKEALGSDEWDFVTLQQVSHFAPHYETYQPYLDELAAYVRYFAPNTKLLMHQTWAYEQGTPRLHEVGGYQDQADMFRDVKASYEKAAAAVNAAGLLPSGELMQRLIKNGFSPVHRDSFHAGLGIPRYAMGALWYELLTGKTVVGNTFRALDVPTDGADFDLVQRIVHELAEEYRF